MTRQYARAIRAELDDRELVAAARAGDRVALEHLLRRHYDRINAVCRRIIGHGPDADDAAQEAMIKIVRALSGFDDRASFATWSYRIATNAALDEMRKRSRRAPTLRAVPDGENAPELVDADAAARVEAVAERSLIGPALAGLPEEFRVAVVLRDVGDLDYAEIAEVLGIPVGTVKSRIARGRALLAEDLGNRGTTGRRQTPAP